MYLSPTGFAKHVLQEMFYSAVCIITRKLPRVRLRVVFIVFLFVVRKFMTGAVERETSERCYHCIAIVVSPMELFLARMHLAAL